MKAIIGIYNSELKARETIEKLVEAGVNGDYIQLLSKYAFSYENGEPSVVIDPNANIFALDHNGLDVPLTDDDDLTTGNVFKNKVSRILSNTMDDDKTKMLERVEEAGYVVAVESNSAEILNKASQILKVSH